ncbi:MAG: class I SAM-dependent methyltransferase [Kineosporiaceae bacterium]
MTVEGVVEAYSAVAELYIERIGRLDAVPTEDPPVIARHLAGLDGPVLDVGCGPGHLTAFLHEAGADVTGIDPVPAFLAHARTAHPGVAFEAGSFAALARPDASVAGVLAWFSLIHTPPGEVDAALAELRRVLRPGGVIVVGFFSWDVCEPFPHKVVTAYRWPVDELSARLASAGFAELERAVRMPSGEHRPYAVHVARAVR